MKLKVSKLALVWDELKKLSAEDDLNLGELTWCDLLFATQTHIEIDEDIEVNCCDDCARFATDSCFLV